jgi:hypothetical protein
MAVNQLSCKGSDGGGPQFGARGDRRVISSADEFSANDDPLTEERLERWDHTAGLNELRLVAVRQAVEGTFAVRSRPVDRLKVPYQGNSVCARDA